MKAAVPSPPIVELARRLVDAAPARPPPLAGEDRRALAWTLKDLCYAAWSSEPQQAERAANVLRALCRDGTNGGLPPADQQVAIEIEALAAWTAGIAQLTRAEMAAATDSFDAAARLFGCIGRREYAAQTQVPKIMALAMLGEHERAVACAEAIQQEFIAHGDVRAASKVSLNLGSLHFARDAYTEAARHYREAAVLSARVADREQSVMADIGLGDTLSAMGTFDEALLIYARAGMRARTHGFPVLDAMVEESRALVHLARGAYRDALGGFERSRQRYDELAMPHHLAVAGKQLADAYLELRLLPEALALYEQSIVRLEALDAPAELAWALAQQGRTFALLEHRQRAHESLRRAGELFRHHGATVGEGAVALVRSELALDDGAAQEALTLATAAAAIFRDAAMPERLARADVLRARAELALGQAGLALASFDAGEQRAAALGLLTIRIQCLTGRGVARIAQGGERAASRADFESAVERSEEQMAALPGDDFQRAFLSGRLRPYQELLRLALDEHARTGHAREAAAVLEWQERCRARALGERIAQGDAQEQDAGMAGQRSRLNWLYRRVQRLQDDGAPVGALADEVRRTEADLLERARRHRLAGGGAARRGPPPEQFATRALCEALRDREALVEYGTLDDELFATVVTRQGVRTLRALASWSAVTTAARSARFQLESLRDGHAPVAHHMDALTARAIVRLQRVQQLVWAPLAAALADVRRVLVVPCGALGALPFAAFVDERSPGIQLAAVPSARLALHGLRRPPDAARSALVFGEPTGLPHAVDEAHAIAAMFPGARTFVGDAATVANLQAYAGSADVIHLACHAQFRADNPMFSALQLHDAALTAEAAESLALARSTVVLSACETALGEHGTGEEMVGLVRAFLVAGASRVVASLWPVDDRVTARFMAAFYRGLGHGMNPAAALHEAQVAIRREHPHPCFWAAFTLFGGW